MRLLLTLCLLSGVAAGAQPEDAPLRETSAEQLRRVEIVHDVRELRTERASYSLAPPIVGLVLGRVALITAAVFGLPAYNASTRTTAAYINLAATVFHASMLVYLAVQLVRRSWLGGHLQALEEEAFGLGFLLPPER